MRLRAAIVGTGRIGSSLERDPLRPRPHTHAGWYASHPDVELAAGADVDAEARTAFARDWFLAGHVYADYREMLIRERPDLVSICAYAPERLEMARAAVEAGARGLWLEKAVGCSVEEGERLLRLAGDARVAVVVNHPRRQDGQYRQVRRVIDEGGLGRLESVHAIFSGNLIHTGTHAWEVLEGWCGAWAEVRCWPEATAADEAPGPGPATGWAARPAAGGTSATRHDIGGTASIRFANGTQAFVSALHKGYFIFQFDAIFSRGRIRLGNEVAAIHGTTASRRYEGFVELEDEGRALEGEGGPPFVDVLVRSVRSGTADTADLEAAVRALELGVAVVQAAGVPGEAVTPATLDASLYVRSV